MRLFNDMYKIIFYIVKNGWMNDKNYRNEKKHIKMQEKQALSSSTGQRKQQ